MSPELRQLLANAAAPSKKAAPGQNGIDIAAYRAAVTDAFQETPVGVSCEEGSAGGVAGTWFVPAEARGPRILYLHGGGYVAGGRYSHGSLAAALAHEADCPVFLAEYRLAPEHRYPAALEDGVAAYRSLLEQGAGRAQEAPIIAGDSAGAGLAVAVMLRLREMRLAMPKLAVLMCPYLNLDGATSLAVRNSAFVRGLIEAYLPAGEDPKNPFVSPLFADLRGLPPVYVQAGGADNFLADAQQFAERARADGVSVTLEEWPEMPHVWHKFVSRAPESTRAIRAVGELCRSLFQNKISS
jgi:monoterpene epsilon-lactone hydrolase